MGKALKHWRLVALPIAAVIGFAVLSPGSASKPTVPVQRGEGLPYEVPGSEVFDLADGRRAIPYQLFVSLPPSYGTQPDRRYPVVFVTDADYGFPMLRLIGRRMNGEGPRIEEFILIGLSYAKGEDGVVSRRRDYTPTAKGPSTAPPDAHHGEALQYRDFLRDTVLPYVDSKWRTQPGRRVYVGHSYGGLLGAQILLTQPKMFSGYVLGSPSLWFDKRHLLREAPALLAKQKALDAKVYMYVGEFEQLRPGVARYQQEVDMVGDNRAFADMLRARQFSGLKLQSVVLPDEDHLSVAPRGFTKGLLYLLPAR